MKYLEIYKRSWNKDQSLRKMSNLLKIQLREVLILFFLVNKYSFFDLYSSLYIVPLSLSPILYKIHVFV